MQEYLAAIPIGIFLSFMIGPVFFVLLETAATKSIKEALFFDLGVILGDIAFILIAYFSSYALLIKLKDNPKLYFFGGLIMLLYGVISYLGTRRKKPENIEVIKFLVDDKVPVYKLVLKGFLLNFMNIGVLGFWLGILINIGPKLDMNGSKIALYFTLIILGYFIMDVIKVLIAKQLKSKLTPLKIRKIKLTVAWIIIVFGFFLMIKTYLPLNKIISIL
jgi:threonine/homoserine/homoserine lactone efflux protein